MTTTATSPCDSCSTAASRPEGVLMGVAGGEPDILVWAMGGVELRRAGRWEAAAVMPSS